MRDADVTLSDGRGGAPGWWPLESAGQLSRPGLIRRDRFGLHDREHSGYSKDLDAPALLECP